MLTERTDEMPDPGKNELMEALDAEFQQFRHQNDTPDLRLKMEKAAARVLQAWCERHPDQVPDRLKPIRLVRMVIRPDGRLDVDLKVPRHLIQPEMLPDDDTEGEEWKS